MCAFSLNLRTVAIRAALRSPSIKYAAEAFLVRFVLKYAAVSMKESLLGAKIMKPGAAIMVSRRSVRMRNWKYIREVVVE